MQESGNTSTCLEKERVKNATMPNVVGSVESSDADKLVSNKLITDYFTAPNGRRSSNISAYAGEPVPERKSLKQSTYHVNTPGSKRKCDPVKKNKKSGKLKDAPHWCGIPGTPFRVVSCLVTFLFHLLVLVIRLIHFIFFEMSC